MTGIPVDMSTHLSPKLNFRWQDDFVIISTGNVRSGTAAFATDFVHDYLEL